MSSKTKVPPNGFPEGGPEGPAAAATVRVMEVEVELWAPLEAKRVRVWGPARSAEMLAEKLTLRGSPTVVLEMETGAGVPPSMERKTAVMPLLSEAEPERVRGA